MTWICLRGTPTFPRPEWFCVLFHVNRIDLTTRAVASIEPWWKRTYVLDNSDSQELTGSALAGVVQVVTPTVPLTFSQSMEWARRKAIRERYRWYAFMHNDAEVVDGLEELPLTVAYQTEFLEERARTWGLILTNYDALAAFNTHAVCRVGPWDPNLTQYGAESDYYRRLRLAGFDCPHASVTVRHEPSQTIRADARRRWFHERINGQLVNYYREKWGGAPGEERYTQPWKGEGPPC